MTELSKTYKQAWISAHTGNSNTEDFIRILAWEAHQIDPNFGLNGKRGDPNDISDDVLNYKGEGADTDPTAGGAPRTVIDVIAGAGGPNPTPAWAVVTNPSAPVAAAWVQPTDPGVEEPIPAPTPEPTPILAYPGDAYFTTNVGVPLEADYKKVGQSLNAGSATWFARTIWRHVVENMPIDDSVAKSQKEWRQALGFPS